MLSYFSAARLCDKLNAFVRAYLAEDDARLHCSSENSSAPFVVPFTRSEFRKSFHSLAREEFATEVTKKHMENCTGDRLNQGTTKRDTRASRNQFFTVDEQCVQISDAAFEI